MAEAMLPTTRAARALLRRSAELNPADPYGEASRALRIEAMAAGISQSNAKSRTGFTINQSRKVWDLDDWTCVSCGSHVDLTVDHIVPVARGGSDELDNLQTMCRSCNSRKGAR